jgi:nitrite reductase (NADH) large subunit
MKKYLIIGNGVAGTTAAQEIRKNDPEGQITMVTEENVPFYSRIMLPNFVSGASQKTDLIVKKEKWYADNNIDIHIGVKIASIDPVKKEAVDTEGKAWSYDSLLLANGSHPFVPPIEGSTKQNVFSLRSFQDAENITNAATKSSKVTAIGGGLLGLEAAHALVDKGLNVTVVEFFDRLLPRQMDGEGALMLKGMLEKQGFNFKLGAKTKEIQGEGAVSGVALEDGEVLPSDFVLFSAGVRPNLDLPQALNLKIDKAVVVDEHMKTSVDDIYAAGDVAEYQGTNFSIWPEAMEQGRIAGANMSGKEESFKLVVPSNRLKVAGIDLASAGNIDADNKLESEVEKTDSIYRKIVKENGKTVGCIMLGDTKGFLQVVKEIGQK